MTIARTLRVVSFLIAMLVTAAALAVSSSLWESDSKDDFDAGEPDGVSVMPPGQIVLGPTAIETPFDALFTWSLTEDSKGNIYAGTGSDGKVFRVPPGGEAKVFAELELQQVFALVAGKKDVLYAGGFPGGKVYSIDAKGEAVEYFDTGQDSVWSLCLTADGKLMAATGDEGQLFEIEAKGGGSLLYDSPERRILSLLCDADGNVYAGSEQGGIIYRIDPGGRPFVFYDTDLEEVTSMTMDSEGNLYAASTPGDLFMKIPPKAAPVVSKGGLSGAAVSQNSTHPKGVASVAGMPAIPSGKKRTSFIYKITKDGAASKFWMSPEKLIFSLAYDGANILAGTGDDGGIYMIMPTGEDATFYKVDQKQVLSLFRSADGRIVAAAGNDAAVVSLGDAYSDEGVFISQAHDATAVSKWGRIFWEAEVPRQTRLLISTRSGNSEKPDDTWSEWSRENGGAKGFVSESPVARFVQWRARLSTSNPDRTPTLRKVTVAYLQANLPPEVKSISVDGNGGGNTKGGAGPAGKGMSPGGASGVSTNAGSKADKKGVKAAPTAHKTKLEIKWKTEDGNGDDLEYELYFKGTGEKLWKLIEDELTEKNHEWDTEAVPDGEYHVKLVVNDSPSNPEGASLTAERVSEPFMVDNTPPRVESLRAARSRDAIGYNISGVVSDNLSPVRSAHYSIDAGDWVSVFPSDGIFDSLSEKVEFATGLLDEGEHTVVVKTVDYFGNVGAGKVTFEVK